MKWRASQLLQNAGLFLAHEIVIFAIKLSVRIRRRRRRSGDRQLIPSEIKRPIAKSISPPLSRCIIIIPLIHRFETSVADVRARERRCL